MTDPADPIRDCFLFRDLSPEEIRTLGGIRGTLEAASGAVIVEEGSPGEGLYSIVEGQVRVVQGKDDSERELTKLGKGEHFGEMSLIEDTAASASVVALAPTKLLRIGRRDLERVMEKDPRLAAKILRAFCVALGERLRRENRRLTLLSLMVRV